MGQHIFETIFIELGRALAAARRYENLRYSRACRVDLAGSDIARRIFDEFYAYPEGFGTAQRRVQPVFAPSR